MVRKGLVNSFLSCLLVAPVIFVIKGRKDQEVSLNPITEQPKILMMESHGHCL